MGLASDWIMLLLIDGFLLVTLPQCSLKKENLLTTSSLQEHLSRVLGLLAAYCPYEVP